MRRGSNTRLRLAAAMCVAAFPLTVGAQSPDSAGTKAEDAPPRLFASHEPIAFTLTTDLRTILRDKSEDPEWRDATLSYVDEGDTLQLPVRVRTRGLFRLRYCSFPPLRLNFVKDSVKGTLFAKQDEPKLGTHCREHEEFEQYAVQEYLLYRVYAVLEPVSYRVRLARITYVDRANAEKPVTRWGFLVEDPGDLADRVGAVRDERQGTAQSDLDHRQAVLLGLFQYLAGNTDWSVPGLHNIEILRREGERPIAVPFDFDWSGAIATRYARPDERLGIQRVTQRIWRGVCPSPETLEELTAYFNAKRPEIEALYRDFAPLEAGHARRALEYIADFYEIINTPRHAKREILESESCRRQWSPERSAPAERGGSMHRPAGDA